jgi:hypothetical protein
MKRIMLTLCALVVRLHGQSVLPHLAMGGGWTTTIYVTNGSGSAVNCGVNFFSDTGALLFPIGFVAAAGGETALGGDPVAVNLPPLASEKITLVGAVGSSASTLVEGSAWSYCPTGVSMTGVFSSGAQSAAVPTTPSSSGFLIPFDNTGGLVTGIAITSTNTSGGTSEITNVAIVAYDGAGNVLPGSTSYNLPYQGHTAFVLSSEIPSLANVSGTLTIECAGGSTGATCSALGIQFNGTAFTSLPAYAAACTVSPATICAGASQSAPAINSVSPILPQASQTITITGSGFGSQQPYSGGSKYIQISDLTAGWNLAYASDAVGLNITSWTDTQISIQGFTGPYGSNGWLLNNGDQALVQVWNAQTGAGPAAYRLTIQ